MTFPADFLLIAALNPCSCGYHGDLKRECRCSPLQVQRYRERISGPLLDRIDIHLEVRAVTCHEMAGKALGESYEAMRERVVQARGIQRERFGRLRPRLISVAPLALRREGNSGD